MDRYLTKIGKVLSQEISISKGWKEFIATICCLLGFTGILRGLSVFQLYVFQEASVSKWGFLDNFDPTSMVGFFVGILIFIPSVIACLEFAADDAYNEENKEQ